MPAYFYTQPQDALNNFSAHAIEIDGIVYPTAEHAYQAAKCTDPQGKAEVIAARSPLMTKQISNDKYKSAKDPNWDDIKLGIMENILRIKLSQHPEVRESLLATGSEEIAEDSPVDYFWGRGKDGAGQNQLGKLWMRLRDEIK